MSPSTGAIRDPLVAPVRLLDPARISPTLLPLITFECSVHHGRGRVSDCRLGWSATSFVTWRFLKRMFAPFAFTIRREVKRQQPLPKLPSVLLANQAEERVSVHDRDRGFRMLLLQQL